MAKRIQATMPNWKNVKQKQPDKEAVPGIRAVATPGHTPGHTSYLVSSGGQQMIVLGDSPASRPSICAIPGWHIRRSGSNHAEATRRMI